MNRLFIITLLFLLPLKLYADPVTFLQNIDKILTISADFEQINEIKGFGKEIYKGEVKIITKDKALWNYTMPANTWYLFTKDSFQSYDAENNQFTHYKEFSTENNILLELLMNLSLINSEFKTSLIDNKLTLTPIKDIGVKYIEIIINNDKIESIRNIDFDGNSSVINFSNMVFNQKIDKKYFKKIIPDNATIFE